jgi:hypothetical protein
VDAAISPRASSSQVPKPDVEQTTQSRGTSVMAGSTSELGRGTHSQDGHVATAAVVVADVANLKKQHGMPSILYCLSCVSSRMFYADFVNLSKQHRMPPFLFLYLVRCFAGVLS